MVIVFIGIIAVFAAPRLGDITAMNAAAFRDKLRADFRYVQNLAMTRNSRARVYFNGTGTAPGAGYAVVIDNSAMSNCSSFVPVSDPARGGNLTVTLMIGDYANIFVTANTTECLEYDSLGRPYDCSANLAICSSTSSGATFDVNGSAALRVTVTIQTGAVN
jgi:hypothetical protein